MGASTAWGHEVVPLTGDKLALAIELGETCGAVFLPRLDALLLLTNSTRRERT